MGEGTLGKALTRSGRGWWGFSLGVLEEIGSEAEAYHSSKMVYLLNKRLLSFFTKPLPLEFAYGWRASELHFCLATIMVPNVEPQLPVAG